MLNIEEDIVHRVNQKVVEEYRKKFMKEVDFHHKVAYRFEKAYRLIKKTPQKKNQLNLEIIEIISDHSDYIKHDPMSLFYCLYFCVYYDNPDMVEFMRTLIKKIASNNVKVPFLVDKMLEFIDVNGIQRLRARGERLNIFLYHLVMYQAFDDHLRFVYAQIIHVLKFIQLRDSDAVEIIVTRDDKLI